MKCALSCSCMISFEIRQHHYYRDFRIIQCRQVLMRMILNYSRVPIYLRAQRILCIEMVRQCLLSHIVLLLSPLCKGRDMDHIYCCQSESMIRLCYSIFEEREPWPSFTTNKFLQSRNLQQLRRMEVYKNVINKITYYL